MGHQHITADAAWNLLVQIILDSTKQLIYFKTETEDVAVPIICILVQLFYVLVK